MDLFGQSGKKVAALLVLLGLLYLIVTPESRAGAWGTQGYPLQPVKLAAAGAPAAALAVKGAKNEDLLLVFALEGVQNQPLQVELARQGAAPGLNLKVWQLRPVPAELPARFFDDGLVPLTGGLTLPASPMQVAVSLKIPPSHPEGQFVYELAFKSGNLTARQPLNLQVWRFSLPEDLPITTLGVFWPRAEWFQRYVKQSGPSLGPLYEAYLQAMREYKFNATNVYGISAEQVAAGRRIADFPQFTSLLETVNRLGFRYFRVPGFNAQKIEESKWQEVANKYFPPLNDYLKSKGWGNKALVKLWDEPKPPDFAKVARAYGVVKAVAPNIRTESAGWGVGAELAKTVDIWATYGEKFEAPKVAEVQRQGQEIWLYANKLHGSAQPPVSQRMIGWYLYRHGLKGYLAWAVNSWPEDVWTSPPGQKDAGRRGAFFYPDPQTGLPLPTVRLESLRRGWEDYLYLDLFTKAKERGAVPPEVFRRVQEKFNRLTDNLSALSPSANWAQLEELRLEMGEALNRPSK